MKSFAIAALAAGAAAGYAPYGSYEAPSNGSVWTTTVLTKYETYCPGPTSFTHGGQTYTATEATTITVTNCPCTVSYPVSTSTYSSCVTCSAAPTYSTSAAPVYSSSAAPEETSSASPVAPGSTYAPTYSVPSNATLPAGTAAPSVAPTKATSSPIASFTGAASKAFAASGASLAAVFGLVAYAL